MTTLLTDIQAFCEANGISLSDFGEMAMRDRGFATRLRNGRDVKLSTAARVRQFMAEYPTEQADAA